VIYEMTFKFSYRFLLPFILGGAAFIIVKYFLKDNITAAVGGVIVLLAVFFVFCFPQIKIYGEYKTENFIEVSGDVKNFQTSDTEESFTLNGVEFSYKNGSGNGYNTVLSQGGVVKGDNELLYIRYVEFMGKKVICYIEKIL
ncbi:MAG: hypothetical protein LUD81_10645, partial [Clostridiales bacterium]|nr:hypothetical protein [Clostridiales bacterium]